jgi:hypothetical protein
VIRRFCCVDPHGSVNVLQPLLANIGELGRDLASNLIVGRRRDADAARFGDALKPRSDVDTVPENVVAFDQDVSEIDPDPEEHTPVLWDALVPLAHHGLHSHRALDRIDYRGKLKQHAVPRGLHEAPPVLRHESIGNLAVFAERAGGAYLVEAHEARVPGNVSGDNCGEPASYATWLPLLHGQAAPGDIILSQMLPDASLGLGRCFVNGPQQGKPAHLDFKTLITSRVLLWLREAFWYCFGPWGTAYSLCSCQRRTAHAGRDVHSAVLKQTPCQ